MKNLNLICRALLFGCFAILLHSKSKAQISEPIIFYPDVIAGEMPVSYDVSATGGFTYTVPIDVPPGINGLIPNLAITYNSQAGNGLLGMGWTLAGVSSITRTHATIFHDNQLDAVDFDGNDIFMLDGQRLVPIGGNMYMTELKNFAKITAYGTAGNGPEHFIVEHPNGLIYEYGKYSQARFLAYGKQDVLTWALNRIYDQNGNYIDFSYHNNPNDATFRLTSITYTGNANNPVPTNTINFTYLTRFNDRNKAWFNGSFLQETQVLSQISVVHNDSSNALVYGFTYAHDFYTHLTEIWEIRPGFKSLPPIKINWGNSGVDSVGYSYMPGWYADNCTTGDFNGDGATDLAHMPQQSLSWQLSDKQDGFQHPPTSFVDLVGVISTYRTKGSDASRKRLAIDYNGDGYDDVMLIDTFIHPQYQSCVLRMHYFEASADTFINRGVVFEYANDGPDRKSFVGEIKIIPGDYDGNGKTDFMMLIPSDLTGYGEGQKFDCFIVSHAYPGGGFNGNLGTHGQITYGEYREVGKIQHEIYQAVPVEFDGDGKQELLISYDAQVGTLDCEIYQLVTPSYANGLVTSPGTLAMLYVDMVPTHKSRIFYPNQYPFKHGYSMWPGDFNGDGKTDLLTWEVTNVSSNGTPGTWNIYYSKGKPGIGGGWELASNALPLQTGELFDAGPWFPYAWAYHVADFNGDGKADILQIQNNSYPCSGHCNITYNIYYSAGINSFTKQAGSLPDSFNVFTYNHMLGDFNGDGQTDIATSTNGSLLLAYFKKNDQKHLVKSIDHAGRRLEIVHKSLGAATKSPEDGDNYAFVPWELNGHTQTEYPYISKQIPIKVVAALSDNISLHNTYQYQTLSTHVTGLGLRGFKKVILNDVTAVRKTENEYSLFPRLWGTQGDYGRAPVVCTTTVYANNNGNWEPALQKRYSYIDEDGGAGGKVRLFINYGTIEVDYATGSYTDIYKHFAPIAPNTASYEFGQPVYVEVSKGVRNGYIIDKSTYTYNLSAAFFNRGKPISVQNQITYPGQSTYTRTTAYQYNGVGLLAQMTTDPSTPNETTYDYLYDAYGNKYSEVLNAPNASPALPSIVKNWDYTNDKRFIKRSHEYYGADTYTDENILISNWGKVEEFKDRMGLTTKYEYDVVNRLIKTETPEGIIKRRAYKWAYSNPTANPPSSFSNYAVITANQGAAQLLVEESIDGVSGATYEFQDFYKRKIRDAYPAFDGQMLYTDVAYAPNGVVSSNTSPYPAANPSVAVITTFTYDYLNREETRSNSLGVGSSTTYEVTISPCKIISTVNTSGGRTKITHADAKGIYKIEDNNVPIETFYNSNGKPNEIVINGDQNLKTVYQYDNYGRVISKSEPNTGTLTYTYNPYDQLMSETDQSGVTYNYTYDVLGRVIEKKQSGQPFSYTYTYYNTPNQPSTGKLMLETSPYNSSKQYFYDTYGRLEAMYENTPGHAPFVTQFTYDAKSRIATRTYPSGHTIQNNYNNHGFLKSIDLIGGATNLHRLWEAMTKDHLGNFTQAQYFDRNNSPLYTIDKVFDPLGYIYSSTITHTNNALLSYSQTNFNIHTGNLQDRTDKFNHTQNFQYDTHDRLTNIDGFLVPITVEYSDEGNIRKKSNVSTSMYQWKYNKYALTQVPEPETSAPGWILPQDSQTVTYYPFKKVKDVTEQNYRVTFIYGPDEQRCKAFWTDIQNPSAHVTLQERYYASEYEKTVNSIGEEEQLCYVSAGGRLVAILKKDSTAISVTDSVFYIATDHLGSITEVLDDEGIVSDGLVEERSYDAWGRPRDVYTYFPQQTHVPPNWKFDRGYTEHEHIWLKGQFDFGIINMNGRIYDPVTGRMFSPDPLVSNGAISECYNKYAYANNNPLKYTDPSGNAIPVLLIAGAVFGGATNLFMNMDKVNNLGQGLGYFAVGAAASVVGAAAGGVAGNLVAGGAFNTGLASGTVGGALGGFVGGTGNSLVGGNYLGESLLIGLQTGAAGAISGGIMTGIINGLNANAEGYNFFNGKARGVSAEDLMKFAPPTDNDPNKGVKANDENAATVAETDYRPEMSTLSKAGHTPEIRVGRFDDPVFRKDPDALAYTLGPKGKDYSVAGKSIIVINKAAFQSGRLLYYTVGHELSHAIDISNGSAAKWYQLGGNKFARGMSELRAYRFSLKQAFRLGDWRMYEDFSKSLRSYENALGIQSCR